MLTLQLNQTELQIGKVPGMEMSTAFGSNEEDEKKEAPFWTSLQDMSQETQTEYIRNKSLIFIQQTVHQK